MGLIKSIQQLWAKSAKAVDLQGHDSTLLYSLVGQDYTFGTQSKDFLLKAYGMNPYVFMVIDRICQRFVQIDKKVIDRTGAEVLNPEFEEILKKPNTKESGDALLYRASATYLASGECFVIRHQVLNEPDQYFVPVNYNVTINEDTQGNTINYWVTMFGKSEAYLKSDVLHIAKPDITFDTNHGFSTLRAIRKVWESNSEVWNSEAAIHKNKGVSGVLYSDGSRPMTPTEQTQLQEKYDKEFTGADKFGKVKVSTSKLGYIPMGMNPNDLNSIGSRIDHLRTICAAYNVDSKLFGDPAASTYNNMAEAQRAFIVNAVIPLSKIIIPEFTKFLSRSTFAEYSMILDEENITELQLTKEQKSARVGREVVQGILTPQEARRALYPELEDAEPMEQSAGAEGDAIEGDPAAESANSEAQANLRGSVGGVQGILDIQASVIAGTTPRDSAITILMQIYGFEESTANEILGT